jgi:outer membrane lipoprotein-sorting protein
MRPADKTKQFIKNASIKSNPEVNEAVLKELLNELDQSKSKPCAARELNIWRIIMKSPITKIATAAVILVSVVAGIYFLGVPTESVAWADVVRPILTARTVVFNVEGENIPTTKVMNMGTQRVRGEVLSEDGKTVQVIIFDYDTFRMLQLIPSKKEAVVIDLKDLPEEPENILEELRNFVTEIQNDPEISVEQLGEKEIDGRVVTGFRARNPDGEFTVWADPQTALPIRIEQTWRQMQFVYTDFQFDIEMDESLFSMEIPEGYSELRGELPIGSSTEQDLVETLRMWVEVILDDAFPEDFSGQVYVDDVKKNREKFVKLQDEQKMKMAMKMGPGFIFVQLLKPENDWRYVGKNVKLGDAESPVCWYKPIGSQTYRVIYGDLSIRDILEEELPK